MKASWNGTTIAESEYTSFAISPQHLDCCPAILHAARYARSVSDERARLVFPGPTLRERPAAHRARQCKPKQFDMDRLRARFSGWFDARRGDCRSADAQSW